MAARCGLPDRVVKRVGLGVGMGVSDRSVWGWLAGVKIGVGGLEGVVMSQGIELPPNLPSGPASFNASGSWTRLVGLGLGAYVSRRARRLSDEGYWRRESAAIQLRTLRSLLSRASGTKFGKVHGFSKITSLNDVEMLRAYRAELPVRDWYAFKDDITAMREGGEPDVLWPGLVRDFAQTSGTTAGDKFIPVSKEMLRSNFRASLDIFANLQRQGVRIGEMLSGRCLFLGGSSNLDTNRHGIRTGDLSGIVTPLIKWPISTIYLPGPEVALMSHWPSKIEAMARRCINEDVRMISGMPSWAMVLAQRLIALAGERGITSRVSGEEGKPITTLRQVWPNLRVFVHGGVRYQPFEPRMRQVFSGSPEGADIPTRFELYPASEGFIAMQDAPNAPGRSHPSLRLNVDLDNFFEFVPLEEINESNPRAVTPDRVEPGQRYCVILTTCAGLWRYNIGDVVEFDAACDGIDGARASALPAGPARLRIVGRHRHFINAFGENLIVEHIENAVARAAHAASMVVGEFHAAPVYPGEGADGSSRRAGLELAIEVEDVSGERLSRFREAFDLALKEQNVDYTTKRTSGVGMGEPTITPLRPGAFHRWMDSRGKLGGQHKCPRCANNRETIEAVVRFGV